MKHPNRPTIPREVIETIVNHFPHLKTVAHNIPTAPAQAERALAVAYLLGETRLSVRETWNLGYCSMGEPYGGVKK